MKELFKVNELSFYEEDFLDDINEYLDIVDILRDMQSELSYEKVTCATQNDCCEKRITILFKYMVLLIKRMSS